MLATTTDAIRAMLKADPTVTPDERRGLLAAIRNYGRAEPTPEAPLAPAAGILRRREVATLLKRSDRAVDRMATEGILSKVTLPGRKRACGFRASEIHGLIENQ